MNSINTIHRYTTRSLGTAIILGMVLMLVMYGASCGGSKPETRVMKEMKKQANLDAFGGGSEAIRQYANGQQFGGRKITREKAEIQ